VVRADPVEWELVLAGPKLGNGKGGHTAREWARMANLTMVINAGMFAGDHVTHLGYMQWRGKVGCSRVNRYQSVAAFDPKRTKLAPYRIFDLDHPGVNVDSIRKDYASLVQNLRLVKRPGQNRWSQQGRKWSEAALGEDRNGNVVFVFTRSPYSMHDLNHALVSAGIGLVALQHLEGGPEAQLYLKAGGEEIEAFGSYETAFNENDANDQAWPIPNVLGIRRRQTREDGPS